MDCTKWEPSGKLRTIAGILAVAALGGLVACGDDDGSVTIGEVEVVDAGQEPTATLPPDYEVGQSADATASVSLSVSVAGQDVSLGFEIDSTKEVTAVEDGEVTIEETLDSITVDSDNGAAASELESVLNPLVGETLVTTYDTSGRTVGETELKDGGSLPDEFVTQTVGMLYPEEPVGDGGRWSVPTEVENQGFVLPLDLHYELTELDADAYEIDLDANGTVDDTVDGADVGGTVLLWGDFEGDRANPLELTMNTYLDADLTVSDGGATESISLGVTVEIEPR